MAKNFAKHSAKQVRQAVVPATLFDAFEQHIKNRPSSTALVVEDAGCVDSYSWSQLGSLVYRSAGYLQQCFLASPSMPRSIGYRSGNTLDDIVLTLASTKAGVVNVPLNTRAGDRYIDECWKRVGGLWIDSSESRIARGHCLPTDGFPAVDPSSPALILWTSGTSGTSKGVVLSHASLLSNAAAKLAAVPQSVQDVRLTCLSVAHAYARTCDLGTWLLSGCTLALTYGFDGWQRLARIVKPTTANVVPSIADRLLELNSSALNPSASGLERLRVLGVGGAGLSKQAFQEWKSRGVAVTQGYGCTETAPVICSATPDNAIPNRVGKPVDGWQTDIRDGCLFVKGDHLMIGYHNDPIATKAKIDPDGWFDTGDLVEVDTVTGQYQILGRVDEVIVLPSGHKVFPTTIELIVNTIPSVRHSMLRYGGGQLELWVDLHDHHDADVERQIETALAEQVPWQRPRSIHQFANPLSIDDGELTPKGTLCRSRIETTRSVSFRLLPDHSWSLKDNLDIQPK